MQLKVPNISHLSTVPESRSYSVLTAIDGSCRLSTPSYQSILNLQTHTALLATPSITKQYDFRRSHRQYSADDRALSNSRHWQRQRGQNDYSRERVPCQGSQTCISRRSGEQGAHCAFKQSRTGFSAITGLDQFRTGVIQRGAISTGRVLSFALIEYII